MSIPKGTDFTKSAERLTNPAEVRNLLLEYGEALALTEARETALKATEAYAVLNQAQEAASKAREAVREAVERCGSYQDVEAGHYAVKQRKFSVSYDPVKVREVIPQFAAGVIEESVPKNKILGLVRGGLITSEQEAKLAITTELQPAFIIAIVEEGTNADKGTNREPTPAESGEATPGRHGKARGQSSAPKGS